MADFSTRQQRYQQLHAQLAALSDQDLTDRLTHAQSLKSRISWLEIAGHRVLIKRLAITELEREPVHYLHTDNLFRLPLHYQYPVGSRGFGVWRELSAQRIASEWVLTQQCENFPLLYHWRLLPRAADAPPVLTDAQRQHEIAFWQDDTAIQNRLRALQQTQTEIVMFLEYLPQNLMQWCGEMFQGARIESSLLWLESELAKTSLFMQAQGLIHFDAHFENILTDGERLYFTDFGLANSLLFELAPDELDFLQTHQYIDFGFVMLNLMHVIANPDFSQERQWIALDKQRLPAALLALPTVVALIDRYWELAATMDTFFTGLYRDSVLTPYPTARLARLISALLPRKQ